MRKINALLKENADSQFNTLAKQANAHLNLRQFWEAIAPKMLSQHSFAGSLNNGQLVVYANNATVATKIKLTSASLLTQLQNLQKSDPFYRECKVTAIVVKVQVKSQQKPLVKMPRKLSNQASNSLKNLAEKLGDTPLSASLRQLASKQ
jgi:hypothetical protein